MSSWRVLPALGVLAAVAAAQLAGAGLPAGPAPQGLPDGLPPLLFRSFDGSFNNPFFPEWGSAGTALVRLTSVDYGDGVASPAGAGRPGPRAVSNAVVAQPGPIPAPQPVSDFVWQWGQFLDHDLDLTGSASPPEPFDVPVPAFDAFFDPDGSGDDVIGLNRSLWMLVGASPVRQQVNQITAWIDASNVYGSDEARAAALRLPDGRLKTSAGNLLPFNVDGLPNAPSPDPSFFVAGDVRSNEQNGLTAMHTLFVREHNRLVDGYEALGVPPDLAYEFARAVVGAEMQVITYREWLPRVLGPDALPPYAGWHPEVQPGVANAFSTACFRFGHTMLSPMLQRLQPDMQPIAAGHLPLKEAFFNPQAIVAHGIEPLLRGLAMQRPQAVDTMIVDDVRNFLFGPPGAGGFDLASLNIQRGRDHGLPGYNQARVDFGLAAKASLAEVSSDPAVQARLASVYAGVDDVDLWVGMLAEDHLPGALLGELASTVLADQFARVRDGDRFWYEFVLPPDLQAALEARTLADVIRDNCSIGDELPDAVFIEAWTDLGLALAGSAGEPRLGAQGSLLPGTTLRLDLAAAQPAAPAMLVVGAVALNLPFKGGTLVPWVGPPLGMLLPFTTGAAGGASFVGHWPNGVPSGTTLYLQAWIADPGAPFGFAGSNALRGDTP